MSGPRLLGAMREIVLPTPPDPEVSVIVLAWTQVELLERCLRSLAEHRTSVPFEVVVVLNGASTPVRAVVNERVVGARVVDSSTNLGFAGGNNLGAAHARADLLVLLNDDAEVLPCWLDRLVAAVERPEVGAVGSLVLFPDGSVQDAGGVIWADGSTAVAHRGRTAHEAARVGRRRVDYASGCSLLVRREVWEALGGLDTRYHPAYYEDTDLCLAMARAGWQVLVEPTSMILHHESASSTSRVKDFLFRRNRAAFAEKWDDALRSFSMPDPDAVDAAASALDARPDERIRLLVIDDRAPSTVAGSGFPRSLEILADLARRDDLRIGLLPTAVADLDAEVDVAAMGIEILVGEFEEVCRRFDPDVVLVSRPHNAERAIPVLRRECPDASIVVDVEALFHRRIDLQVGVETDPAVAATLASEARRVEQAEREMVQRSDLVVTLSVEEHDWIRSVEGHAPVELVVPWLTSVAMQPPSWATRRDALFVAGWLAGEGSPNADGLHWYHDEVLPHLARLAPDLVLQVTGGRPSPDVAALAGPSVRFVGRVPDLGRAYASARVAVAPVRFGAGLKNKVMEAIQTGVPIVTTSVGAEGFDQVLRRAIVVRDDPRGFAEAVAELALDPRAWSDQRLRIEAACARTVAAGLPTVADAIAPLISSRARPRPDEDPT